MRALVCGLMLVLLAATGCTFFGEKPAKTLSEATGGESLERVFWEDVKNGKWVEIDRALASNYVGVSPGGMLDREAALAHYRQMQLKDYSLGDLKTEMNGNTFVVSYTITFNGTIGSGNGSSQPLPSTPQHMMTVWQQQKSGWIEIAHAHSVSQP